VSLIVPVHAGGESFQRCLESIRAASPAPDEVIIVVDGPAKEPANLAAPYGFRIASTPAQSGPASARNLGAQLAQGDILFFVDADVTIPPPAITEILRVFQENPEVSALMGSYDDTPAAGNLLSQYKNLFHHYVHQHASEEGYTFWGACGAIRRDVFLELGGFDPKYRQASIEDIELGYRLKAAGRRIRVCKNLQVKHLKRWTVASLFQADFFRRALPWTDLILRAGRLENDLNIDLSSRVKVALVFFLIGMLGLAWWWPAALWPAAAAAILLLVLDAPLLRFFRKKRGIWFALRTIPWHWFYYLYSGLAFAIGMVKHAFRRRGKPIDFEPQPSPADAGLHDGA
jgi:GT2 family glycosyltransferase